VAFAGLFGGQVRKSVRYSLRTPRDAQQDRVRTRIISAFDVLSSGYTERHVKNPDIVSSGS
jgi:hypothetical protein